MIKALRFCYGTAFVFLRGASKQPQNWKNEPVGCVLRAHFFFFLNAPLALGWVIRVGFLDSVYEVVGGHKTKTPKNEPPKTDAM